MGPQPRLEASRALRLATQALTGRIRVPLDIVRARLAGLSKNASVELYPAAPGLRIRGQARALGAPISFSARIDADGVEVSGSRRTLRIRLTEVTLATDDDAPGPLADAIRNGMIDTENPAMLIGNMVRVPDMVVSAEGQDIVVDLLKVPAVQKDDRLRTAIATLTSYVCVTSIRVEGDEVELQMGLIPGGAKEAALSTARAALTPLVRYLWPEGQP